MNDREIKLYVKAIKFCVKAHGTQIRRYTGEPYWHHPVNVSNILVESGEHDIDMLCAAVLHDVVEDTETTVADVSKEFGKDVAKLVDMLTDVSKPEDGNRKIRKSLDRDHLLMGSDKAKTIKLADLIDNSESIVKYDQGFAKVYMVEKKELLGVLVGGSPELMARASKIVSDYFNT